MSSQSRYTEKIHNGQRIRWSESLGDWVYSANGTRVQAPQGQAGQSTTRSTAREARTAIESPSEDDDSESDSDNTNVQRRSTERRRQSSRAQASTARRHASSSRTAGNTQSTSQAAAASVKASAAPGAGASTQRPDYVTRSTDVDHSRVQTARSQTTGAVPASVPAKGYIPQTSQGEIAFSRAPASYGVGKAALSVPYQGNVSSSSKAGLPGDSVVRALTAAPSKPTQGVDDVLPTGQYGARARSVPDGVLVYSITDATSGLKTTVTAGEPSKLTAPELKQQGILAHKGIMESRGGNGGGGNSGGNSGGNGRGRGQGGPRYRLSTQPRNDFKIGNVIELRWIEPMDGATLITRVSASAGSTRVRRFVIVRSGTEKCAALPILTYGGRGAAYSPYTFPRSQHAVIYTGDMVPPLLPYEEPTQSRDGQWDQLWRPIRVVGSHHSNRLDPHSRLNFAKVYQIDQASCEIYVFGYVHPDFREAFLYQYINVRDARRQQPAPGPARGTPNTESTTRTLTRNPLQQGAGSSGHVRFDSAVDRSTLEGRPAQDSSSSEAEESEEDEESEDDAPATSRPESENVDPSRAEMNERIRSLYARIQSLEVDGRSLTRQEILGLARRSRSSQTRALLDMLRTQNPRRYTQVVEHLRRERAQRGGSDSEDED